MTKPKSESLLQEDSLNMRKCYFSNRIDNLERHHIFQAANRKWSEIYGCWVWLTADWHRNQNYAVHRDIKSDLTLKIRCQQAFEEKYSREVFMNIFGRSWL